MSNADRGPRFNLKAVVQQTGIKPDTLRAWERRYGLPAPARSSGRHRLYSQRDVDTVNWLSARLQEGLRIKQAVDIWRGIEAEGRDPLQAPAPGARQIAPAIAPSPRGETMRKLRESWLRACLAYDEQSVEQVVNQAFALFNPETVVVDLLQKGLAQIGQGWYRGNVTVQQEHFCSALVMRRLESLLLAAPASSRPGSILVACPPGEEHVIGPLLLTYLFRRRGWQVIYLGANVPIEHVDSTVASAKPRLVVSAAQRLQTAATLAEAADHWHAQDVLLAYGGLIFNLLPALRHRIAGHFLGERLEDALPAAESLIANPRPAPPVEPAPEMVLRARGAFAENRARIEAEVMDAMRSTGIARHQLAQANQEFGLIIDAALALGDMDFLGTDSEWTAGLLRSYGMSPGALHHYLSAYHEASKAYLDERGRPIFGWFRKFLAEPVAG